MADKQRYRIKNLLQKLNDEDRKFTLLPVGKGRICSENWQRATRRKRTDNVLRGVLGGGR